MRSRRPEDRELQRKVEGEVSLTNGATPTVRQRVLRLAGDDAERKEGWLVALRFAKQLHDSQVVHVEGVERRILPHGGLQAAAHWPDAELATFLDFLVLVRASYECAPPFQVGIWL